VLSSRPVEPSGGPLPAEVRRRIGLLGQHAALDLDLVARVGAAFG
jgi:hypothetical protein